jgi:hypothetical protein
MAAPHQRQEVARDNHPNCHELRQIDACTLDIIYKTDTCGVAYLLRLQAVQVRNVRVDDELLARPKEERAVKATRSHEYSIRFK